jgi:CubicO group peptidase (beta-lactamase class C family)
VEDALESAPFLKGALMIYHKGTVVYRSGFGLWKNYDQCPEFQTLSAINVASLSKTYSAALAMAVMDDPEIGMSLGDLVKDYIPNALSLNPSVYWDEDANSPGGLAYDAMTIGDLISMTTGHDFFLPWPTNLLVCINNPLVGFEKCGEEMVERDIEENPDHASYVYEPGTAFGYSAAPWQILGLALVNAVNDAYDADLDLQGVLEKYLTGADACDLPKTRITPPSNEWMAGGVEIDFLDGGKFAEALLTGKCNDGGHTLLSASRLAAMRESTMPQTIVYNPDSTGLGYGRGVWIYDADPAEPGVSSYMGVGAWGAITFFSPDDDWAAYLHLNDHVLSGFVDAVALAKELTALITEQAITNP